MTGAIKDYIEKIEKLEKKIKELELKKEEYITVEKKSIPGLGVVISLEDMLRFQPARDELKIKREENAHPRK